MVFKMQIKLLIWKPLTWIALGHNKKRPEVFWSRIVLVSSAHCYNIYTRSLEILGSWEPLYVIKCCHLIQSIKISIYRIAIDYWNHLKSNVRHTEYTKTWYQKMHFGRELGVWDLCVSIFDHLIVGKFSNWRITLCPKSDVAIVKAFRRWLIVETDVEIAILQIQCSYLTIFQRFKDMVLANNWPPYRWHGLGFGTKQTLWKGSKSAAGIFFNIWRVTFWVCFISCGTYSCSINHFGWDFTKTRTTQSIWVFWGQVFEPWMYTMYTMFKSPFFLSLKFRTLVKDLDILLGNGGLHKWG